MMIWRRVIFGKWFYLTTMRIEWITHIMDLQVLPNWVPTFNHRNWRGGN